MIITKTGFFAKASRTWCTQDRAYHTTEHLQHVFIVAKRDQRLTTTTDSDVYHGANIVEECYTRMVNVTILEMITTL